MVNASFELRYLNPIMIFHSFTGWIDYGRYNEQLGDTSLNPSDSRVGSLLGLAADVRPLKGLRLYALFAMTEKT